VRLSRRQLHAEKVYDSCHAGQGAARGTQARFVRRSVDSRQRPGRHRWIVEGTHARMACLRRLALRYERRDDIQVAFTC
jgi:hypothetical protein